LTKCLTIRYQMSIGMLAAPGTANMARVDTKWSLTMNAIRKMPVQ